MVEADPTVVVVLEVPGCVVVVEAPGGVVVVVAPPAVVLVVVLGGPVVVVVGNTVVDVVVEVVGGDGFPPKIRPTLVPVPAPPKIDDSGLPEMSSMAVTKPRASTNTTAMAPATAFQPIPRPFRVVAPAPPRMWPAGSRWPARWSPPSPPGAGSHSPPGHPA